MQALLFLTVLGLAVTLSKAEDGASHVTPTFEESYLVGMRAYTTNEEWATCNENMQRAVKDFDRLQLASLKCLKLCESEQVRDSHHTLHTVHPGVPCYVYIHVYMFVCMGYGWVGYFIFLFFLLS